MSDFIDFLHVVICILLDNHWSYQNMLFRAGIVRHRFSTNQIVRCFGLKKNWKLYKILSWFFASIEATKNIMPFWVMLQNNLGQSVCRIFYFWLVNLNTGGTGTCKFLSPCNLIYKWSYALNEIWVCNVYTTEMFIIRDLIIRRLWFKDLIA